MTGYTRWSPSDRDVQLVGITSVDAEGAVVTGLTAQGVNLQIDVSQHVGAVEITPARGEQWYVERWRGTWRPAWKRPENDPKLLTAPVEGQVRIGSTGPLELSGAAVQVRAPLVFHPVTSETRPEATAAGAGSSVYDVDLGKPLWSDGQAWRDALGNAV